jgi:hypothetical protein
MKRESLCFRWGTRGIERGQEGGSNGQGEGHVRLLRTWYSVLEKSAAGPKQKQLHRTNTQQKILERPGIEPGTSSKRARMQTKRDKPLHYSPKLELLNFGTQSTYISTSWQRFSNGPHGPLFLPAAHSDSHCRGAFSCSPLPASSGRPRSCHFFL